MPALNGQVVSTITDGTGTPVFVVTENYDAVTFALVDKQIATSAGTRTGALVVDNRTGRPQGVTVTDPESGVVKAFTVPTTGVALTAATLAGNKANNGGPITTIQDLAGLSPTLT